MAKLLGGSVGEKTTLLGAYMFPWEFGQTWGLLMPGDACETLSGFGLWFQSDISGIEMTQKIPLPRWRSSAHDMVGHQLHPAPWVDCCSFYRYTPVLVACATYGAGHSDQFLSSVATWPRPSPRSPRPRWCRASRWIAEEVCCGVSHFPRLGRRGVHIWVAGWVYRSS